MTDQERHLLELYLDDDLTDAEAQELAERIASSDPEIVDELAFTGLLGQALDPISDEQVVDSVMVRLDAESDADGFVSSLDQKLDTVERNRRVRKWMSIAAVLLLALVLGVLSPRGGSRDDLIAYTVQGSEAYRIQANCTLSNGESVVAGTVGEDGDQDFWIARLDSECRLIVQQTVDFGGEVGVADVVAAPGGGVVVAGTARDPESDSLDAFLIRIDHEWNVTWKQSIGLAPHNEWATSVVLARDGRLIVCGLADAAEEPEWITNADPNIKVESGPTAWVMSLSGDGRIQWQRTVRYRDKHIWRVIDPIGVVADDGAVYVTGWTSPEETDDLHLTRFEPNGHLSWSQTIPIAGDQFPVSAHASRNGGVVIAGLTDPDLREGSWICEFTASGKVAWRRNFYGEPGAPTELHRLDGPGMAPMQTREFHLYGRNFRPSDEVFATSRSTGVHVTYHSPEHLELKIGCAESAVPGVYGIELLQADGRRTRLEGCLEIHADDRYRNPDAPFVESVEPRLVEADDWVTVAVRGGGFAEDARMEFSDPGVETRNFRVVSSEEISIELEIPPARRERAIHARVLNPDGGDAPIPFFVMVQQDRGDLHPMAVPDNIAPPVLMPGSVRACRVRGVSFEEDADVTTGSQGIFARNLRHVSENEIEVVLNVSEEVLPGTYHLRVVNPVHLSDVPVSIPVRVEGHSSGPAQGYGPLLDVVADEVGNWILVHLDADASQFRVTRLDAEGRVLEKRNLVGKVDGSGWRVDRMQTGHLRMTGTQAKETLSRGVVVDIPVHGESVRTMPVDESPSKVISFGEESAAIQEAVLEINRSDTSVRPGAAQVETTPRRRDAR